MPRWKFIYWLEYLKIKSSEHPGRIELMLGKIAAILKGVNGVENEGLAELIGYAPPPLPPEAQEKLDSAWFGYWEKRAKTGR